MGVDHPGLVQPIEDLIRNMVASAVATMQNAAIGRAGVRVYDGGWILIEDGGLSVTGTAEVSGTLRGTGTFDWSGDMFLRGSQSVTGPTTYTGSVTISGNTIISGTLNVTGASAFGNTLAILGATTISGATTLNSDLSVALGRILAGAVTITPTGGGQVLVGNISINGGGSSGGEVYSSSQLELRGGSGVRVIGKLSTSEIVTLGDVTIAGDLVASTLEVPGVKNFRIAHPVKANHWLRHGSTESPISGTEYTGRATLDEYGEATVALPDYFEALNKIEGRTVQTTPVGRPFPAGAGEVVNGKMTLYGEPGRDLYWLVKAERRWADFATESPRADEDPAPTASSPGT
ncbi:hypothetical protein J2Y69_002141 [Microbacterium resistens]|uniref:Polymer-forming cytoskeletal protein n=1 Tax=Microbacterium resistens TaxID=156977 RepID=A0ABU1SD47_9MICO|nr:hypothetical protein [Microbacterium resistens]MDR6867537.1 hypothetical protein [Microbacterium resistens]